MSAPRYRLLALDLDGTLTNSDKVVSARTRRMLEFAARNGVTVALASGRPLRGVTPIAEEIDLKSLRGYMLTDNGAQVVEAATGDSILRVPLPDGYVRELAAFANQYGVTALAYDGDDVCAERIEDIYVAREARNDQMNLRRLTSFADEVTWPCCKLMLVGDPALLAPCAAHLKAYYQGRLNVFQSESYFLEILAPGVDKPYGLARLLTHLNLPREALLACGDGLNDIDMLRFAGLGVAMANAYPETMAASDAQTASNDEDGVALAVARYIYPGDADCEAIL